MNSKEKNIGKRHKQNLGFDLPDDYFLKSKNEILSKVSVKKENETISIFKNKLVWFAAAGIALIFALTIFKQQSVPSTKSTPEIVSDTINANENLDLALTYFFEEDVLIASLFINDNQVEAFVNNAFIEDVVADELLDDFIVDELMDDDLF